MTKTLNSQTTLKILEIDPWLEPHRHDLEERMRRYHGVKNALLGVAAVQLGFPLPALSI